MDVQGHDSRTQHIHALIVSAERCLLPSTGIRLWEPFRPLLRHMTNDSIDHGIYVDGSGI